VFINFFFYKIYLLKIIFVIIVFVFFKDKIILIIVN